MYEVKLLGLTLTAEEIFELTGYRRASRQLRSLERQGIRAWARADGTIAVLRAQFNTANSGAIIRPELTQTTKPAVKLTERRRQR